MDIRSGDSLIHANIAGVNRLGFHGFHFLIVDLNKIDYSHEVYISFKGYIVIVCRLVKISIQ